MGNKGSKPSASSPTPAPAPPQAPAPAPAPASAPAPTAVTAPSPPTAVSVTKGSEGQEPKAFASDAPASTASTPAHQSSGREEEAGGGAGGNTESEDVTTVQTVDGTTGDELPERRSSPSPEPKMPPSSSPVDSLPQQPTTTTAPAGPLGEGKVEEADEMDIDMVEQELFGNPDAISPLQGQGIGLSEASESKRGREDGGLVDRSSLLPLSGAHNISSGASNRVLPPVQSPLAPVKASKRLPPPTDTAESEAVQDIRDSASPPLPSNQRDDPRDGSLSREDSRRFLAPSPIRSPSANRQHDDDVQFEDVDDMDPEMINATLDAPSVFSPFDLANETQYELEPCVEVMFVWFVFFPVHFG